ncbi:hypothetical protein IC582_004363 [Cucumis melo]
MEYAAGGEFFGRICSAGRFSEDEARFFFQQLISGVSYCHSMQICYRDLKLENTLLAEVLLHNLRYVTSVTQSLLYYTRNQNRPLGHQHIFHWRFYRERSMMPSCSFGIADAWSCGVTLYVMLVEAYPFEDPEDPRNFQKTIAVSLKKYIIVCFVIINFRNVHLRKGKPNVCLPNLEYREY